MRKDIFRRIVALTLALMMIFSNVLSVVAEDYNYEGDSTGVMAVNASFDNDTVKELTGITFRASGKYADGTVIDPSQPVDITKNPSFTLDFAYSFPNGVNSMKDSSGNIITTYSVNLNNADPQRALIKSVVVDKEFKDNGVPQGTYSISADGILTVKFYESYLRNRMGDNSPLVFTFAETYQAEQNKSIVEEDVTIGDKQYHIVYKPGDIALTKAFSKEENGYLYWTINVTSQFGTASEVILKDTVTTPDLLEGAEVVSVKNGSNQDVSYTGSAAEMHLPKMEANTTYTVTVKTKLKSAVSIDPMKNKGYAESTNRFGTKITAEQEASHQGEKPGIQKKGEWTADGKCKWTITVNPEPRKNIGGMWIVDELDGNNNTKIPVSLQNATIEPNEGFTREANGTIKFNPNNSNTYTITVTTDMVAGMANQINHVYLKRTKPDGQEENVAQAQAQLTVVTPNVSKTGELSGQDIIWTIKVNNNHVNLNGWTLADFLVDTWTPQGVGDKVSLKDAVVTPGTGFTKTDDGNIVFNAEAGTQEYTVVVKTPVNLTKDSQRNKAELTWNGYYKFAEAVVNYKPILKNATWNPDERKITYTLTVNPYHFNMKGQTVTDTMSANLPAGCTVQNIRVIRNDDYGASVTKNSVQDALDYINGFYQNDATATDKFILTYEVLVAQSVPSGTKISNTGTIGSHKASTETVITREDRKYVKKQGVIENNNIKWTITINEGHYDMKGWVFNDIPDAKVTNEVIPGMGEIKVNGQTTDTLNVTNIQGVIDAVNNKIKALTDGVEDINIRKQSIMVVYYTPCKLALGQTGVNEAYINEIKVPASVTPDGNLTKQYTGTNVSPSNPAKVEGKYELPWKITLTSNTGIPAGYKLVDTFTQGEHALPAGDDVFTVTGVPAGSYTINRTNNGFVLVFNQAVAAPVNVVVTYKTYTTDLDVVGVMKNHVALKTPGDEDTGKWGEAQTEIFSERYFYKSIGNFNPDTQEMTWTLTITQTQELWDYLNANKDNPNATIIINDTLPQGVAFRKYLMPDGQ
ncbi:MAG: hypothetical protein Q4C54_07400 [Clostridia bacterium]|nr:hypothetical protein [Clostridia bacterium]